VGACIDLLGCEYLGGCPAIGEKVLGKVELHLTGDGLRVAIAPQGLFTVATAHTVLALAWSEIEVVSITPAHAPTSAPAPLRVVRSAVNVLTMRLDRPYRLTVGTREWSMEIGVRVAPDDLGPQLRHLLDGCAGPTPRVATG
jgi:hypothetical protein